MVANRSEWATALPPGSVGAEIGVMEAQFSRVLIEQANPELLFLVDHWTSNLPGIKGTEAHLRQAVRFRTTLRITLRGWRR
ncbi:hypothetical protein LCGC14_3055640 [marine sediment metagenome]|uniref:Uncharacterized protein n=1 Tax=marine sediment metagenome TaxID=412755 RepID=A0A0F8ZB76_9ZZZZ